MEYLISQWPEVSHRVHRAGHVLLLFDYDGTLAPIVSRPEQAGLSGGTRAKLRALARARRFTVGVISGRSLRDLKAMVGLDGLLYAGNHGLELEAPSFHFVVPMAQRLRPVLATVRRVLEKALAPVKGAIVEDKDLTLSVHYRLVESSLVDHVKATVERIVAPARASGLVKTTAGKMVYEVRPPVDWDKGKAIELVLKRTRRRMGEGVLVFFFGDDVTDEDGFRVVNGHGGVSVFVGAKDGQSAATHFVMSPAEVERCLDLLLGGEGP